MVSSKTASAEIRDFLNMARKYLSPYIGLLIVMILISIFYALLISTQPIVLAAILGIILNDGGSSADQGFDIGGLDLNNLGELIVDRFGLNLIAPWQAVLTLAAAYVVVALGIASLGLAINLLGIEIKNRAGRDLQVDLFQHLLSLSLDFFNQQRIGELIARLDQDAKSAIAGLELTLRNLVIASLRIVFYGYLLFKTHIMLTTLLIIAGILHYVLIRRISLPLRERARQLVNFDAETTSFLQEKVSMVRVVKTFVAETYEKIRLKALVREVMKSDMRFSFLKHIDEPFTAGISALINVGILLFAANELLATRLTPMGFFLYLYIGRSVLGPLAMLAHSYNNFQTTLAVGIRVRQLFKIKPTVVSGKRRFKGLKNSIRFDRVSFGYPNSFTLQDISFEIKRGQIIALVGPSGGGKSTLVDLLLRFYDPAKGAVLFDGQDIRTFELPHYRRMFGVVAQESILFNGTVSENIAYARPEIPPKTIEEAARIANAHEFILELPDGYNTNVGDRGVRLSGGQRQRVAIARAIVHKPEILILDEATSSLDTESEQKVQLGINQAIQKTTAVVIAHRLSTVIRSDSIVVLNSGDIVDIGQHEELLRRCELYRKLVFSQFEQQENTTNLGSYSDL